MSLLSFSRVKKLTTVSAVVITLALCVVATTTKSHSETIRSRSGATAKVSPAHAAKFQALINWLDERGYRIKFIGGVRKGRCWSGGQHPCGTAIDINQTARGKIISPFPAGVTAFAKNLGLVHGDGWCNQDRGHFQVGGWSGCRKRPAQVIEASAKPREEAHADN